MSWVRVKQDPGKQDPGLPLTALKEPLFSRTKTPQRYMLESDFKKKARKTKKIHCKERGEFNPDHWCLALLLNAENTPQTEAVGFFPVQSSQRKGEGARDGLWTNSYTDDAVQNDTGV